MYVQINKAVTHPTIGLTRYTILDGIARGFIRHRTDGTSIWIETDDVVKWKDIRRDPRHEEIADAM